MPQTLSHLIFECKGTILQRNRMFDRVLDALDHNMEVQSLSTFDFTRLSEKGQLEILLGKRTGNPIVDLRIDSAIRQFLRHTRKQSGIADN